MKELNAEWQTLLRPQGTPLVKLNHPVFVIGELPEALGEVGRPVRIGAGGQGLCPANDLATVEGAQRGQHQRRHEARGRNPNDTVDRMVHFASKKYFRWRSEIGIPIRSMTLSKSSQIARLERFEALRRM